MGVDISRSPPSPDVKAHFVRIPWCETLFNDPSLQPFQTLSKLSHGSTFVGETLSTPTTIRAWQSFYKAPPPDSNNKTGSLYYLLSLGNGVNGHVDKAHGGFIGVLLDEVIGAIATNHCPPGSTTMTAFMKVDYKKPLDTPRVVLAKAWIEEDRSQGRKIFGRGSVEDGEGGVFATGEALFLMVDMAKVGLKL